MPPRYVVLVVHGVGFSLILPATRHDVTVNSFHRRYIRRRQGTYTDYCIMVTYIYVMVYAFVSVFNGLKKGAPPAAFLKTFAGDNCAEKVARKVLVCLYLQYYTFCCTQVLVRKKNQETCRLRKNSFIRSSSREPCPLSVCYYRKNQ